jgi:hypothetical protein
LPGDGIFPCGLARLFIESRMKQTHQPRFWKTLERHPLSAGYPDITGPIFDEMVATVKSVGVIGRKITLFEGKVLEGWQLLRACIASDVKPEFDDLPKDIDSETLVKIRNDLRRQSKEEETVGRINARRERVAAAHANGESTRKIAAAENVSQQTVLRDLESPGDTPPVSPGNNSNSETTQKVTGTDGKTYPATQPKILCVSCQTKQRKGQELPSRCEDCETARRPAKPAQAKPTKAGKPRFDEKKFDKAFGALTRVIDERGNMMGKGAHHKRCQDLLGDFINEYKLWKRETA